MSPPAPPASPPLPRVLDSTALGVFASCEERFRRAHLQHWRRAGSGRSVDLVAGGAFARGLEELYRDLFEGACDPAEALLGAQEQAELEWAGLETPLGSPKTLSGVQEALAGYLERYGGREDALRPWAPEGRSAFEFQFAVPLTQETFPLPEGLSWPLHPEGEPFLYAGRVDALVQQSGLTGFRDDKTTKSFQQIWAPGLELRGQFLGYTAALRTLGIPVKFAVARQIAFRTSGKADFRESPPLQPSEALLERWRVATAFRVQRLVRVWEQGYWERALGEPCTAFFRLCDFFDACARGREPEEPEFERKEWSPLQRAGVET